MPTWDQEAQTVAEPASGAAHPRILLVEDEPSVARLTEVVLSGAGYSVEAVTSHSAASQLLAEHPYSLVLADTDRGGQTPSLETAAGLVAMAACPVLLFTAHRFAETEIDAVGFAGVVQKPYDIDDLLKVVREVLARSAPNGNMTTA